MLKKGKFIKEPPPRIGVFYMPKYIYPETLEERFIRAIVLGYEYQQESTMLRLVNTILKI